MNVLKLGDRKELITTMFGDEVILYLLEKFFFWFLTLNIQKNKE